MRNKLVLLAKIAGFLAVLLAAAAAVGTYALKKYLPPEKVRALIAENSPRFIHRQVRLKDLDLSVLNGLAITGLEVSEAPDFNVGTFAKADSFQLRVQLLPLLHATVAVDKVAVGGLRLTVKKDADGRFNFSDIAGSTAPAATPAKAMPLLLDIRHAALSDAEIAYADAGTGDQLTVSGLSLSASDISLGGDTHAEFSFKTSGTFSKKPVQASVSFSGTINPAYGNLDKIWLDMKKASIELPEGKASVSGTVKGLKTPELDLKTEVTPKGLDAVTAEVAGKISDLSAPAASLAVKARTPAFAPGALKAYGVPDGVAIPAADADMKFDLAGDALTLKSLSVKTKGVSADVAGSVAALKTHPSPNLTVAAKFDIPALGSADLAFLKAPEGVALPAFKGEAKLKLGPDDATIDSLHLDSAWGSADVAGTVKKILSGKPEPDLGVKAALSLPKFKPSDLALLKQFKIAAPDTLTVPPAQVDADLHFDGDELALKVLRVKSEPGELNVSGTVEGLKAGKPEPDLDVSAKARVPRLSAADLAFLKSYKVELPPGGLPPAEIDAQFHYSKASTDVKRFHLKSLENTIEASGSVSAKLEPAFDVSADLKIPDLTGADLAFLKSFKIDVPSEASLPATSVLAKLHYTPDEVSVSSLHLKNKFMDVSASGAARGIKSGKPQGKVEGSAALHLPQLTARDLAVLKVLPSLKIPDSLAWPATEAAAKLGFDGVDLTIESLTVNNRLVDVQASGSVKKLLTAPEPRLVVKAKTDLPAFTAADVSFLPGVPAGLKVPASHFETAAVVDPDKVSLKVLNLRTASQLNDFSITESGVGGLKSDSKFFTLHIDGKLDFKELASFLPPMDLVKDPVGVGRLEAFTLGGRLPKDGKPNVAVTGKAGFAGLGATVAGLALSDFAGNLDFNDKDHRIDSQKIKGKIGDGALELDLTVRNFNSPVGELSVEMQKAELTKLDVGRLLEAKAAFAKSAGGAPPDPAAAKPFSFKVFDGVTVRALVHPYALIEDANLKGELTGITPDLKRLNGTAHFQVGRGTLLDLDRIAGQSPLFKVLTLPILIMRGLSLFPNLKEIGFSELTGDYEITDGDVRIKEFHLTGDKLQVKVNEGQNSHINLARDKLYLDVYVKAGIIGLNKVICGSISKPDTACVSGEAGKIIQTVTDPGKAVQNVLNIFKK